jgi:hypothetical protein
MEGPRNAPHRSSLGMTRPVIKRGMISAISTGDVHLETVERGEVMVSHMEGAHPHAVQHFRQGCEL